MYINPKANKILITKEKTHNLISLCFFMIINLVYLLILLVSSIEGYVTLIVFSALFLLFGMTKYIYQIYSIVSLSKMMNVLTEDRVTFYIAKSINRKKESTIWLGSLAVFINIVILIISLIVNAVNDNKSAYLFSVIVLSSNLILMIVTMMINVQRLDEVLKFASKIENFESIEWKTIANEQSANYKWTLFYGVSIILVIPVLFLLIPKYRNFYIKLIEKK